MELVQGSIEEEMIKNAVVALDSCVFSDILKYLDRKEKEQELKNKGKWDENFMEKYERLYGLLKQNNTVILPLLTQIEIATNSMRFLDVISLIKDLNCQLVPFPSAFLMKNISNWINLQTVEEISKKVDRNNLEIVLSNMDESNYNKLKEKAEQILSSDMLVKYIEQYDKSNKNQIVVEKQVADILSLIYRQEDQYSNRMMQVKDMFDAITLAECKVWGAQMFITANSKDFSNIINFSLFEDDPIEEKEDHFKNYLIPYLYKVYNENYNSVNPKNMLELFKRKLHDNYYSEDLMCLYDYTKTYSIGIKDQNYKKFVEQLGQTIYTQRKNLKVSIVERDKKLEEYLQEWEENDYINALIALWGEVVTDESVGEVDTIDYIYNSQKISEKKDTEEKVKARKDRIEQLLETTEVDQLLKQLANSLRKYKKTKERRKGSVQVVLLNKKK